MLVDRESFFLGGGGVGGLVGWCWNSALSALCCVLVVEFEFLYRWCAVKIRDEDGFAFGSIFSDCKWCSVDQHWFFFLSLVDEFGLRYGGFPDGAEPVENGEDSIPMSLPSCLILILIF